MRKSHAIALAPKLINQITIFRIGIFIMSNSIVITQENQGVQNTFPEIKSVFSTDDIKQELSNLGLDTQWTML